MRITIESFGTTEFSRELLRVAERSDNMRPAFEALADDFYAVEREQFDSEGARGGQRWPPLSPRYAARKRVLFGPKPILEASGRLRRSLTSKGTPGNVHKVTADEIVIGSRVDYGKYHQSTAPRSQLRRRPPVVLTEADKVRWVKKLQRYLMTGEVEQMGFGPLGMGF